MCAKILYFPGCEHYRAANEVRNTMPVDPAEIRMKRFTLIAYSIENGRIKDALYRDFSKDPIDDRFSGYFLLYFNKPDWKDTFKKLEEIGEEGRRENYTVKIGRTNREARQFYNWDIRFNGKVVRLLSFGEAFPHITEEKMYKYELEAYGGLDGGKDVDLDSNVKKAEGR